MSQKWRRSQAWDDANFPAWAWPAKFLVRLFSSIGLAVFLLSLVAMYGIIASVPIGMLAAIPSYLLYLATLLLSIVLVALVPTWLVSRGLESAGVGRGVRFTIGLTMVATLAIGTTVLWVRFAWPRLHYNPETQTGFLLFADFCERYKGIVLRRLPGLEMNELEFYAWWPLQAILLTFILNMITATVRRIEFKFVNLGVLTVHTGIVTIAMGSVYYAALKQEGDVMLLSGNLDEKGRPTAGRPETGFFDNTEPVLWLNQGKGWEQRSLRGLPRYNEYNLEVMGATVSGEEMKALDGGRRLDMAVSNDSPRRFVDPDVSFRVVGYASYAKLNPKWRPIESASAAAASESPTPIRLLELLSSLPTGAGTKAPAEQPFDVLAMVPTSPADRTASIGGAAEIEYTRGMDEGRWAALASDLPEGARHVLLVEIPATGLKQVFAINEGQTIEVPPGGYKIEVKQIAPEPPFPIITKGYENASSSVAIVHVTPPVVEGAAKPVAFDRFVYHRFPEINQDLLDETNERGMPKRRAADPAIKLTYIDASVLQVYLDELPGAPGAPQTEPMVRAMVRLPGATVQKFENLVRGSRVAIAPMVTLRLGERWADAERVETPEIVPEHQRDRDAIGKHREAAIALEVSVADASRPDGAPAWRKTLWVPFSQYLGIAPELQRLVKLPDGRDLSLAFGRRWHPFPDIALRLTDFDMIPYPHSTQPRDFRSQVAVIHNWFKGDGPTEDRATSLNDPLLVRVPFEWSAQRPAIANAIGWLVSFVAPTQYKFSQVGWDSATWTKTSEAVASGELPKPFASFTILGVGNNPGIYIIASGAIMMSVGIPWAFYVKPWLVRRQSAKIRAEVAARGARAGAGQARSGARSNGHGELHSEPEVKGVKPDVRVVSRGGGR